MRKLKNFLKLSFNKKLLLFEAYILLTIFRLILLTIKFKTISRHLGIHMLESPHQTEEKYLSEIKNISWAINKMSKFTLWESKCFVQALTAKFMLKRRRIKSTIYFGLRKDENKKMRAHAWLRSGEIMLTGGKNNDEFVTVSTFGDK